MNAKVPAMRRMLVIGLIAVGWFSVNAATPATSQTPAASQADVKATTQPAKTLELDLGDKVMITFVQIPAGKFLMGSPKDEKDHKDNEVQRQVTIPKPFFMGIYDVTQTQYKAVMGTNPSDSKGADNPVDNVSWDDCNAFCKKASEKVGKGVKFRLPTEAEWEYSCRAGAKTAYFFGGDKKDADDYAWHRGNSGGRSHPVGQKKPNPWGLYDIVGNLGQWCEDPYVPPPAKGAKPGPAQNIRIFRGGFWDVGPEDCRSGARMWCVPFARNGYMGFRVVVAGSAGN